jgi:hypothetical protein
MDLCQNEVNREKVMEQVETNKREHGVFMGFILRSIQLNDWAAKSFEECHNHVVSGVWGVGLKMRVKQHFDLVKGRRHCDIPSKHRKDVELGVI